MGFTYTDEYPLHLAVIDDAQDRIFSLLKKGVSLEQKDIWGLTPIKLATYLDRQKCLELFQSVPTKGEISFALEEKYHINYTNSLIFQRPEYLFKALRKCRKTLRHQKHQRMNRWALALFEKQRQTSCEHLVTIDWINGYLGNGVFAAQNIKELTYIGEYTGIVCKKDRKRDLFNNYIFGYVVGPKGIPFIINAKEHGNFTRFINHSNEPNLTSRWLIVDGITHIILFANQCIPKGKQITYDYGEWYWHSRSAPILI